MALNDLEVGGMFDRGGRHLNLDEVRGLFSSIDPARQFRPIRDDRVVGGPNDGRHWRIGPALVLSGHHDRGRDLLSLIGR